MKICVKKGLASRRIAGELFIVDAAGSRLHELNATGSVIWAELAAGRSPGEIAAALAAEFEVEKDAAEADVKEFLKAIAAVGLLVN